MTNYNILNIVVNTERFIRSLCEIENYNILNIVVNTERGSRLLQYHYNYNILNIVVNTEPYVDIDLNILIITY